MRSYTIFAVATTFLTTASAQSESSRNACSPQNPKLDSTHPCVEVAELEHQCIPKPESGTQQGCLCTSGYFHAWRGCLECMHVHGIRSDDETNYLNAVMDKASLQYCRDGPSIKGGGFEEEFQMIMKQGKKAVEYKEGDKELKASLKDGKTVAVSEYYTRLGDMVAAQETSTVSMPTTTTTATTTTTTDGASTETTKEAKETGKVEKTEEEDDEDEEETDKAADKGTDKTEAKDKDKTDKDGDEKDKSVDKEKDSEKEEGDDKSAAPKEGIATAAVLTAALLFTVL